MTIDTSYQDQYPLLFSGNAGSIPVSYAGSNAVLNITLTFATVWNSVKHEFSLLCSNRGYTKIPLKDILDALWVTPDDSLLDLPFSSGISVVLEVESGGETFSWQKWVVLGATIPDEQLDAVFSGRGFVSLRPQTYPIGNDLSEDSCTLIYSGASNLRIDVMVYSRYSPPFSVTLTSKTTADLMGFLSKGISLSSVEKLAAEAGHPDLDIVAFDAYSVIGLEDGTEERGETLRYIVNRGKYDAFQFYGSHGVLETIYATGSRKSEVNTETATFTNDGVESELVNDSRLVHETFTGWLASAEEVRFWQEFFASAARYAVIDGVSRRIIVDEIDSESTDGELSAFSFKWHYADRNDDPARIPVRQELKQYKPTI